MDAVYRGIERALGPLDWARARLIRALGSTSRTFIVDRELRIAAVGVSTVVLSLMASLAFPVWTLALGPIILGVPHLVADARYMVMRPRLYRRPEIVLAVGAPLLASAVWPHAWVGLLAAVGALAAAQAPWSRRLVGLVPVSGLYWLAKRYPFMADLASVHLHNLVAIALWWAWRDRKASLHWAVIGSVAISAALIFGGAAGPVLLWTRGLAGPASATSASDWVRSIAPNLPPDLALRLVISYAFAQEVHYGLWLRLMPEEDRRQSTPRTFVASFRALKDDLGGAQLLLFTAFALIVAIWGAIDLAAAREGYLRLSLFHVYVEVGVAALLWAERGRSFDRRATAEVDASI